jgi:hypothetical protein
MRELKPFCKKRIQKIDVDLVRVEYVLFQEDGTPVVLRKLTERFNPQRVELLRSRVLARRSRLLDQSEAVALCDNELATLDAVDAVLAPPPPPEEPVGP